MENDSEKVKVAEKHACAIGFSALCISCLLLEIFTVTGAGQLWVLVVIWALCF